MINEELILSRVKQVCVMGMRKSIAEGENNINIFSMLGKYK